MFLARSASGEGMAIDTFSTAAMEAISRASWPGNVRQLQNIIQCAVILAEGKMIRPQDLHGLDKAAPSDLNADTLGMIGGDESTNLERPEGSFVSCDGHIRRLLDIEGDAIARALTLYRGRMTETARRLGIGRSTLYRKIDELQLDKERG